MADVTPIHALPYPEDGDGADGPAAVQGLAEAVDEALPLFFRGIVDDDGSTLVGDGFTSLKNSTGNYTINPTGAPSLAAVASLADAGAAGSIVVDVEGAGTVNVLTYNAAGVLADRRFSFIAATV